MKNINNTTCKWMRVNGDLIPFSDEIPNVSDGNVTVKYYLTKNLTSLEEEFKDNDYIQKVSLANMNVSELSSLKGMLENCSSVTELEYNENISLDANIENICSDKVELTNITDAQFAYIHTVSLVSTIPSAMTYITSSLGADGKYLFEAEDKTTGISCDVILSNWDEYDAFVEEKDPEHPQLPYFLNTQHCKELGVPTEDKFISKNNKNSIVTDPRVCLIDNGTINIHIPENITVDYIVAHISGHNGAASELDYVYNHEDGIYMDSTQIIPASQGTSDIKIWLRDKRTDYKFFNGTLENNKKVWASFEFYKINKESERIELPEITHVNPPIPDEAYISLDLENATKISTNVKALSGICLSENKDCLYGVSDTYGLYKIGFDGKSELLYDTQINKGNEETEYDLEGLCIDDNGDLFACVENKQSIVKFAKSKDYKTCEVVSNIDADKLKETMTEFNNGFEGIAYNKGIFYLGNQFKPISVTKYSLTEGIVGDSVILGFDNSIGGTTEVGDLQYDPNNDTLWVIDSRSSNLYNYDLNGNNLASYKTNIGSKPNTESFVIDFENNKLYVACDNAEGTLYVFDIDLTDKTTPTESPLEQLPDDE